MGGNHSLWSFFFFFFFFFFLLSQSWWIVRVNWRFCMFLIFIIMRPCHGGMHIALDRQLAPYFWALSWFFFCVCVCVPTCFHMIPEPCLSVRPYPEKRNPSFVNISPTLLNDTYFNGKVFTRTIPRKLIHLIFFKVEIEFWLVTKCWYHIRFVNISPTLVIDTSMERSSRVLCHEK